LLEGGGCTEESRTYIAQKICCLEPSLEDLKNIANWLATHYVADSRMEWLQNQPIAQRDQQYKNVLLLNKYCLLYEEFCHGMNSGDIGQVETCLISWIFIFRATAKHKYATHIIKFLLNVHFVYPSGLRCMLHHQLLKVPALCGRIDMPLDIIC
jgi:hypothetical protein